ncbi:MAG: HU-CCDC81 and SPOR domain-containing protein [Eudoraea sp.]|nr:HU-CCDC81 and SPOR domain-containing protein [Eudoraea sp.]
MSVELYICELLYRYNCVVIPEFGAFLTHIKSASIDRSSNTWYPPSKEISFNQQLETNDGLLISHMAAVENASYETMLAETAKVVKKWKKLLQVGGKLVLNNIGELQLNGEGRIVFQPAKQVNYLTSSFGLSSFVSAPVLREELKVEAVALEEKVPFIITPEERSTSAIRPLLKYAAIALLAISTGLTGYRIYNETVTNQLLTQQKAQEIISNSIQEATFFDAKPLELPALELELALTKKVAGKHHVVAGAFREKSNANKKIRQLLNKGYDAFYIGQNKFGLHQVAFDSFENPVTALKFLANVRQTESKDAWMLSVK